MAQPALKSATPAVEGTGEQTPLERAIYIGDSEVDVATARAAGIPCISACWGYRNEEELLAAGARHLCRTPRDIPAALEELRHGQ